MNKERLLLLADDLASPEHSLRFNMAWWVGREFVPDTEGVPHLCGTSVCAMGRAALMPEFQAAGLEWRMVDRIEVTGGGIEIAVPGRPLATAAELDAAVGKAPLAMVSSYMGPRQVAVYLPVLTLQGRVVGGIEAAMAFFEIDELTANMLFMGFMGSPKTADGMAALLRMTAALGRAPTGEQIKQANLDEAQAYIDRVRERVREGMGAEGGGADPDCSQADPDCSQADAVTA